MHASAYQTARQFFEVYAIALPFGTVVEIGSRQAAEEQRTLRTLCPSHLDYVGLDLEPGINVDIVMNDPYVLPLGDDAIDIVLCTSVFEHCDFFWELFEQILRVLKPGGLIYVNAPSNGYVHRHPVDCWRFYPDSGVALAGWGSRRGHDVALLESFIADEDRHENPEEIWNDFVGVFVKGRDKAAMYPQRMMDMREDYVNARRPERPELVRANRFPGRSHDEVTRALQRRQFGSGRVHLYQIAYSEQTWASVPEIMLPLDNRANERPDWAEYWPIRRFLQTETLDENVLYGFLSPRFSEKLFFPPEALIDFAASVDEDVDVAAFSPFFDRRAVFLNVFEQSEYSHPGMMDLCKEIVKETMPGIDLGELVNTSMTAIFCNYFAAKPRFWRQWLAVCEQVFAMAESPAHSCSAALNRGYVYGNGTMPAKVFVIERMASLLLAASDKFKVAKFEKSTLTPVFGELPYALLASLDNLKMQGLKGQPMLLNAFRQIQREILNGEAVRQEREKFVSPNLKPGMGHAPSRGYEHWVGELKAEQGADEQAGLGWVLSRIFK